MKTEKKLKLVLKQYNLCNKKNLELYNNMYQTNLESLGNEDAAFDRTLDKIRSDKNKSKYSLTGYLFPCDPSIISFVYLFIVFIMFLLCDLSIHRMSIDTITYNFNVVTTSIIQLVVSIILLVLYLCKSRSKTVLNTIMMIPLIPWSIFKIIIFSLGSFFNLYTGGVKPGTVEPDKAKEIIEYYRSPFSSFMFEDGVMTKRMNMTACIEIMTVLFLMIICVLYFVSRTKTIRKNQIIRDGFYTHNKLDYRNKYVEYGIYNKKEFEKEYKNIISKKEQMVNDGVSKRLSEEQVWEGFINSLSLKTKDKKKHSKYLEPFIISIVLTLISYIETYCFSKPTNINTWFITISVVAAIVLVVYVLYLCLSKRKTSLGNLIFITFLITYFVYLGQYGVLTIMPPFSAKGVNISLIDNFWGTKLMVSGPSISNELNKAHTYNFMNQINLLLCIYSFLRFYGDSNKLND